MNGPFAALRGFINRAAPLTEARLFTDVDLLPRSNQSNDNAPIRNAIRETNELFGFGCRAFAVVQSRGEGFSSRKLFIILDNRLRSVADLFE